MAARNRKQMVFLEIVSGVVDFLPVGTYTVHIDNTTIEKGSIKLTGRILSKIDIKEEEVTQSGKA
jgi:hypothetical protein